MTPNSQISVLLIEDDLQFKKLLEMKLKSILPDAIFHHVTKLADARSLLGSTKRPIIDLVVLDQHLPDGRGVVLLEEGLLEGMAVLAVSSDDSPEIPGANIKAGAAFFLSKTSISQPLIKPLITGILERNRLLSELNEARLKLAVMDSVKTLISTLKHEINNPLGAVLGGAFLLKNAKDASSDQREAAELVEASGKRIKHVLEQLVEATDLSRVEKGGTMVFHIPGDKPWDKQ